MEECLGSFSETLERKFNLRQALKLIDIIESYNSESMRPTDVLGKLSAVAMLTTNRVGDPTEDETMVEARPRLSLINEKGFVTVDSQMGVVKSITLHDFMMTNRRGERVFNPVWDEKRREGTLPQLPHTYIEKQRSYVEGIMSKDKVEKFKDKMFKIDSVIVLVRNYGSRRNDRSILPLTLEGGDRVYTTTGLYMDTRRFEDMSGNLLPEMQGIVSSKSCQDLIENDSKVVFVIDTRWGRKFWLMDMIIEVLDDLD